MRESQYQIPVMVDEVPAQKYEYAPHPTPAEEEPQVDFEYPAELTQPELDVETFYGMAKKVQDHIDMYRYEALHAPYTAKNPLSRIIASLTGGVKYQAPSLESLIDGEAAVGGALFGRSSRFWIHPQLDSDTPGVRDWYFNAVDGRGEYTIRYQTSPQGVTKIYKGLPRPFTENELQHLYDAIAAYDQAVAAHMYGRPVVNDQNGALRGH